MFSTRIAGRVALVLALFALIHRPALAQKCSAPSLFPGGSDGTRGVGPSEMALGEFNHDGLADIAVLNQGSITILRNANPIPTFQQLLDIQGGFEIVAADFDHNGWDDVAVTVPGAGTLNVAFGTGAGDFLLSAPFPTGAAPTGLTYGDYDNDGHLDLAVFNGGDRELVILRGNGARGLEPLSPPISIPEGAQLATGDVNGDGSLDIVTVDGAANRIYAVLLKDAVLSNVEASDASAGGPESLALADFNHDGTLDVATVNASRELELLRGDGSGRFESVRIQPIGPGSYGRIAAGDVDGDGDLDVVMPDRNDRFVVIALYDEGSGGFDVPVPLPAQDRSFDALVSDFDRDGRNDVGLSLPNLNAVQVLLNDFGNPCKSPSFERLAKTFPMTGAPVAIAVGDFDEDGNPDFFTANQTPAGYHHGAGRGDGSFVSAGAAALAAGPVSNTTADFDFDGDLDVITALNGALNVHRNVGGTLATGFSIPLPGNPYQVAAADVSFDGKPDLIVSLVSGNALVFLNDGSGSFPAPSPPLLVGSSPRSLAVADFDSDGHPDLAVAEASNQIVFFKNNGDGTFVPQSFMTLSASPTALRAADMNGDGRMDLVFTVGAGPGARLQIRLSNGAFGFTPAADVPAGDTTATRHGLEIGRFNTDAHLDVAVALSPRPEVRIFLGSGSGLFTATRSEVTPETPGAVAAADSDRDGILDLLVSQPSLGQVLSLQGDGTGRFSPGFHSPPGIPNPNSRGVAHGDFNRDGALDLAIANLAAENVTVFLGDGKGNFGAGTNFSIAPSRGPRWVTAADFDDDGTLDLLVSATGSDEVVFLGGDGSGGFKVPDPSPAGGPPTMSRAADFDLDGKLDVAVIVGGLVHVLQGDGAGGFSIFDQLVLGGTGAGLCVGDFDRNGLVDIAATQVTDHNLVLFRATAPGAWTSEGQSLAPLQTPTDFDAADFDGDGFVDFIVPLEGSNQVTIVRSDGFGDFLQPGPSFITPRTPGVVRALDWNRDGLQDLVVASRDEHVLAFYEGRGDGSFSFALQATAGVRIPAFMTVADFNADARTDIAVVPDTSSAASPAGVAVVLNTNCRSRQMKLDTDVSTCDLPNVPFITQPRLRLFDDGDNLIECENRAVTASILPGTGSAGAFAIGTTSIVPVSGVVTFSNLGVSQGGAGFRMQFTHAEARRKLSRSFSQGLAPTISGPSAVCQADPTTYSTDGGYELYRWLLDSSPLSMAPSIDLTGLLTPGPHRIDVLVEQDTCTGTTFLNVDVTANLSAVDVAPLGPISLCPTCTGPLATVSSIGGLAPLTYQWGYRMSPGGTIAPIPGETGSSYTIEAADLGGVGTRYLVATVTPSGCGAAMVSNEVRIDISTASTLLPLHAFTALSTTGENFLELATAPTGDCSAIRILRNDTAFPTDPNATGAPNVWVSGGDLSCPVSLGKTSFPDGGLANGQKYFYSAWVRDASGSFSPLKNVSGRPFDTSGQVKWSYSTGATSMSQSGLRVSGGSTCVYIVSNDSMVHAIDGGPGGGRWLAGAVPAQLGLPSQARPPVVPFPVGAAANGAAFVTSQDGRLYALDADTLANAWAPATIGQMATGAAAGMFAAFGGSNILLAGTRNTTLPNELRVFDVKDGSLLGFFDNSGTGLGIVLGGVSVDYASERAFFGSRSGPTTETLWAVDVSVSTTPTVAWSASIGEISGTPVYLFGRVVVGTDASTVELRNASDGSAVWPSPYNAADGPVKGFVFPHLHSGTWYFMFSTTTKVTSIRDGASPALNWERTSIPSPSTPIWLPGTTAALVGGGDGILYRLDGIDTTSPTLQALPLTVGAPAVGVPTFDVPNQMIYVGTDEGVIYAVQYPFP